MTATNPVGTANSNILEFQPKRAIIVHIIPNKKSLRIDCQPMTAFETPGLA